MIKIKTFEISDESINDFIGEVSVINDGIKVSGDKIAVVYREGKYLEYNDEVKTADIKQQIFEENKKLTKQKLDLQYFDKFPVDEKTGVRRRQLEENVEKTKGMIEILEKALEE